MWVWWFCQNCQKDSQKRLDFRENIKTAKIDTTLTPLWQHWHCDTTVTPKCIKLLGVTGLWLVAWLTVSVLVSDCPCLCLTVRVCLTVVFVSVSSWRVCQCFFVTGFVSVSGCLRVCTSVCLGVCVSACPCVRVSPSVWLSECRVYRFPEISKID